MHWLKSGVRQGASGPSPPHTGQFGLGTTISAHPTPNVHYNSPGPAMQAPCMPHGVLKSLIVIIPPDLEHLTRFCTHCPMGELLF